MRSAISIVYFGLLAVVSLYLAWNQDARWLDEAAAFLLLVAVTFLVQLVLAVRRAIDAAATARAASNEVGKSATPPDPTA